MQDTTQTTELVVYTYNVLQENPKINAVDLS